MSYLLAVAAIVTANVIGGISYLWQDLAVKYGLPHITISLLRNAIALVLVTVWLLWRRRLRVSFAARDWGRIAVIGVFGFGAPMVLGVYGVDWSTAGNGAILILLEPLAILFFSWLFLRERLGPLHALGVAAGLAGAVWVAVGSTPADQLDLTSSRYLHGNIILGVHGILWGLYSPLMKPLAVKYPSVELTYGVMLTAMAPLLLGGLVEIPAWKTTPNLGWAFLYVALLGIFVSLVTLVLWNYALQSLRASTIAPFIFLQPVVGVLADYWVLGKVPAAGSLYGGLLIGAAVLLVIYAEAGEGKSRPRTETEADTKR